MLYIFYSSFAGAAHLQCRHVWPSWRQQNRRLPFHSERSRSGCVLVLFLSRSPCSANTGSPTRHFGTVHWAPGRPPGSAWAKLINASCRGHGSPPADRPQEDPAHLSSAKWARGTHSYTLHGKAKIYGCANSALPVGTMKEESRWVFACGPNIHRVRETWGRFCWCWLLRGWGPHIYSFTNKSVCMCVFADCKWLTVSYSGPLNVTLASHWTGYHGNGLATPKWLECCCVWVLSLKVVILSPRKRTETNTFITHTHWKIKTPT